MQKIPTLFKREFDDDHNVTIYNQVKEGCEWVLEETTVHATWKMDGEAVMVKEGILYSRYDTWEGNMGKTRRERNNKKVARPRPIGAIPCMAEPDTITGSFPCWVPATNLTSIGTNKYQLAVWDRLKDTLVDGTYEMVGPHFQNNPDKSREDTMVKHGSIGITDCTITFEGIQDYLETHEIEGIVFYRDNGQMCKIKRTDFGLMWGHDRGNNRTCKVCKSRLLSTGICPNVVCKGE